ncbi:MAG: DUF6702 family protein [Ferruginibacter sp.]
MVSMLYKWSFISLSVLCLSAQLAHPIFVSVTTIDHNLKEKSLEITCKVFTDDFEKLLRSVQKNHVDLVNPPDKSQANQMVSSYLASHLKFNADGKPLVAKFIGYEIEEEGVVSYLEVKNITSLKMLDINNTLLYEMYPQQMGIMHVTVDGKRQSTKLNNPESSARFTF